MALRLPREDAAMSVVSLWFGRALGATGALVAVIGFAFDSGLALLGAGLTVLGAVGALVSGHRIRRPPRHIEVEGDTVVLRPEGRRHAIADLGERALIEWSFKRTDPSGMPVVVHRAAVRSRALDCELYLGASREACAAWLARFEDALAGRPRPEDTDLRPIDRFLEAPPPALLAGWAAFSLLSLVALGVLHRSPDPGMWMPLGMAALVLAAVWGWAGVGRRGVAAGVGLLGAVLLAARPLTRPLTFVANGVTEPLGPFAEPHLTFWIGGALLMVATLVATRRLGARTAS